MQQFHSDVIIVCPFTGQSEDCEDMHSDRSFTVNFYQTQINVVQFRKIWPIK